MSSRKEAMITALVMGVFALIPLPALIILPGVGWPDFAQGASAAESLPVIMDNIGLFRLGYGFLTLNGLLFWPATYLLIRALRDDSQPNPLLQIASGLAVATAATRVVWYGVSLTAFPILYRLWASGDETTQAAVDVVFVLINDIFSTIQEDIGVNLLGAASAVLIALVIWQTRRLPRWLAMMGLISGGLYMSSSAELIGLDAGDLIAVLAPTIANFWYLFLGLAIWGRSRQQTVLLTSQPKQVA